MKSYNGKMKCKTNTNLETLNLKKKKNIKPNITEKTNSDGYTNLMAAKWNEKKKLRKCIFSTLELLSNLGKK